MLIYKINMDYYLIYQSLIFWYNMYLIFNDYRIDFCTLLHSIVTGIGSQTLSLADNNLPYFALGYSIYDLYTSIKLKKTDFIVHGLIYSIGFFYCIYNDFMIPCNIAMMMNTSSIFLQILRIMKTFRYDIIHPVYFMSASFIFTVLFIYYRLILFPYMIYNYLSITHSVFNNQSWYILLTGAISISVLNIWWLFYIIKKFVGLING